ncbi:molybdopterin-dependent oxidoreductase [Streptomyces sp. B1866]|uniref:molybdopterin-dependent oxidoreductase n=1 Tax=Streptomyces sp. B1866 TaxID=3075431 RepID=UPI002892978C|nr:molybdopterin-dependent oxidoreductase [Streptomyces sp. B1866]MDT3396591.1 molybdopterin-dependent oxidoreductase [Streptomyces sp. B1866]
MVQSAARKTACILCECNCGIEIQLDGRRFARIRGDKAHPASQGYTCEKPLRLDHYQNGRQRLTSPLRRLPDGTYERIDWDTAIREIAAKLAAVRDAHGGHTILHYGGGQGNHLCAVYDRALLLGLGGQYSTNALAQEKTGETWVDQQLYGSHTKGDFERSEVAVFLGKNPWQSHSFPHARPTLRRMAADPDRAIIVVDPRRTETADLAEFHLRVRPGTDAWCLAAMLGVLVQEDLVDHAWLAEHTTGTEPVLAALAEVPVADYARRCGVEEDLLRAATRRIARASSVSTYEDLGVEHGPNSTLCSYLNKLLWILTGNFAKPGAMHVHSWMFPLLGKWYVAGSGLLPERPSARERITLAAMRLAARPLRSLVPRLATRRRGRALADRLASALLSATYPAVGPRLGHAIANRLMMTDGPTHTHVSGAPLAGGLFPPNFIAEEILADHPDRIRAMWVDGGNPAHSVADSPRFKEAMAALDLCVVIDVAFTETARLADYVLPASSQFEKYEATFFNVEFPRNTFHLRRPVLDPLPGTRSEDDIIGSVIREIGLVDDKLLRALRTAATGGRAAFSLLFFAVVAARPDLMGVFPYLLRETLGPTLPEGAESAAVMWGIAHLAALSQPDAVRRAGFTGTGHELGERLFDAIMAGESGVTFTVDDYADAWNYVCHPDRRIRTEIPELLDELRKLPSARSDWTSEEYPFVLSAGERRAFTANAIYRDPAWRRRDAQGALRMHPDDAGPLAIATGSRVRVVTEAGSAEAVVEVTDTMYPGHLALPNGLGVDHPGEDGVFRRTGTAPNDLTPAHRRDHIIGTPWHKHVPARVEPLT